MKKTLWLFSILNCFIGLAFGQNLTNLNTETPPPSAGLSVGDAANIANNIDYYTGRLNYNIPLKNVKIAGIDFAVGLHYSTTGFKVQEVAGTEGLGWSANFTGVITRSVRGLADEDANGYCGANRIGGKNYGTLDNAFFQNTSNTTWDSEPDLFYFSIMGLTGTFVLDPDGNPVLKSHSSGLRIDVCPFKRGTTPGTVKWLIRDQSGNQYIFESAGIESTYNYYHGETANNYKNYVSSWYITKIITAANETVNFSYTTSTVSYTNYVNEKRRSSDQYCTASPSNTWNENIDVQVTTPYLTQVSGNNTQILYNYSTARADLSNGKALSSINIAYNGKIVNTYTFGYDYFWSTDGTGTGRLKLTSIAENYIGGSNKVLYSFFYNEAVNLPARNSLKSDYWGYYNNNASDNNIIGFSDKTPVFTNTMANVLTRVQTVFGGSVYFEYELNNYFQNNQNNPIGGLRLKDIYQKNADSDTQKLNQVNYTYTDPVSGFSSGQKFMDFEDNGKFSITIYCSGASNIEDYFSSEPTKTLFDDNGSSVGYSKVTVTNSNGSATRYTFTNYSDYPDTFTQGTYSMASQTVDTFPETSSNFPGNSYAFARGKILKQEDLNNGDVVKTTQYSYSLSAAVGSVIGIKAMYFSYTYNIGPQYIYQFGKYTFSTQDLMLNSRSETYSQGGVAQQSIVQNYTYTTYANNLMRSITNIVSGGKTDKYTLRYPFDVISSIPTSAPSASLALSSMTYNNSIAIPVEIVHSVIHNSTETIIGANVTQYALFNSSYLPQKEYKFESATPLPVAQYTNYTVAVGPAETGNFDARMKPFMTYDAYDSHNNLLQGETVTNQPVYNANLFGFDGLYKFAEVKGAAQADIAYTSFESSDQGNWQYSGSPIFDVTTYTGRKYYNLANGNLSKNGLTSTKTYNLTYWTKNTSPLTITGTQGTAVLLATRNGWRNYKHVITGVTTLTVGGAGALDEVKLYPSNAQMVTYTYDPFIGLRSKTDNNDQSTYYEYDEFNRLAFVKDVDKNILQGYCYNFKGEATNCFIYYSNNAQTGPFYKNNCAPLYAGTAVSYSVPAGLYNATSQAAADAMAAQEGQAYANLNGSCTPYTYITLHNTTGQDYIINFTSGAVNYAFNFSAGYAQIPPGTYDINIYPGGSNYLVHTITVGANTAHAPRTTFYGVNVTITANQTVEIY